MEQDTQPFADTPLTSDQLKSAGFTDAPLAPPAGTPKMSASASPWGQPNVALPPSMIDALGGRKILSPGAEQFLHTPLAHTNVGVIDALTTPANIVTTLVGAGAAGSAALESGVAAAMKSAAQSVNPLVKFEIAHYTLKAMHVPDWLAGPAAYMISGYSRGGGGGSSGGAAPAAAPAEPPSPIPGTPTSMTPGAAPSAAWPQPTAPPPPTRPVTTGTAPVPTTPVRSAAWPEPPVTPAASPAASVAAPAASPAATGTQWSAAPPRSANWPSTVGEFVPKTAGAAPAAAAETAAIAAQDAVNLKALKAAGVPEAEALQRIAAQKAKDIATVNAAARDPAPTAATAPTTLRDQLEASLKQREAIAAPKATPEMSDTQRATKTLTDAGMAAKQATKLVAAYVKNGTTDLVRAAEYYAKQFLKQKV